MFTLAHLSDPHLPMPAARPLELAGKRATGYFNWWRSRVHVHVPEALAGIVADIARQAPDHIALTGDLVNISLGAEFASAARWLATLGPPDRVTVVPGNHDVYVATAWPTSLGLWGAYMAGDGEPPADGLRRLPDRAPARARGAGRPVERRAEAAVLRHRHAGRAPARARRAGCWPRWAARDCAASC